MMGCFSEISLGKGGRFGLDEFVVLSVLYVGGGTLVVSGIAKVDVLDICVQGACELMLEGSEKVTEGM